MTTDIIVPALGESVSEATVAKWFKNAGDSIAMDEPLVELETDKVTLEVNAATDGVLTEIVTDEGANVEVGALLGRILSDGSAVVSAPAPAKVAETGSEPSPADTPMSPAVRKLIGDHGLDASAIPATGKDGRLTKGDVLGFIGDGSAPKAPVAPQPTPAPRVTASAPHAREERVPMTRLRKRIAERLKEAQNTAAMLTTFNEADMTNVMAARAKYRDAFEKKYGARLGFMSFFVKSSIVALQEIPAVNAQIDGDDLVYKNHYDIGVAVGTEQGLVVPVLRDADQLGFAEVEASIGELGRKARDGKLTMEELTGGTFTITNGGVYGSMMSTPILNPPQSGILGMHKIDRRPIAVGDQIEIRPMMYLALSYDHRVIDGREAVTFLVRVKECIEDPERIMLGV